MATNPTRARRQRAMKEATSNADLIKALGPELADVPVYLGYIEVAEMIPKTDANGDPMYEYDLEGNSHQVTITASAVRNYYYLDLDRGEPNLMPKPDGLVIRGGEVLPLWKEVTIREWIPERQGPGNHTWGDLRRGNRKGRSEEARAS